MAHYKPGLEIESVNLLGGDVINTVKSLWGTEKKVY